MRTKVLFIMLWAMVFIPVANSQTVSSGYSVSGMWGQMLDIYPNFPERGWHTAAEAVLTRKRLSPSSSAFGYPTSGLALSVHRLGNDDVLGWGIGLQYEMKFDVSLSESWYWTAHFRPGLIYNNRFYDPVSNPTNIVTGSRLSALMTLGTGIQYRFDPRWRAELGASLWHSSNGHTALPNVGMNVPLLYLRLHHTAHRYELKSDQEELMRPLNNMRHLAWVIHAGFGLNEGGGTTRPTGGPLLRKHLVSTGLLYRINRAQRLGLTVDAYRDETYALWNATQSWTVKQQKNNAVMLLLSHEFMYQRWSLLLAGGVNLYNPTLERIVYDTERTTVANTIKRYVPGRFAIRYHFLDPWFHRNNAYVQAGVKSNFGQADFLEFGLGFILAKQRD